MKIRKCPHCAQLNHFEPQNALRRCWNCARISDFLLVATPEERVAIWLGSRSMPDVARFVSVGVGRVALVVAVPIAVVMLLVCNSFDIHIVRDLATPFTMP